MRRLVCARICRLFSGRAATLCQCMGRWGTRSAPWSPSSFSIRPAVPEKVTAMIAVDTDNLTTHDIASEPTWADRYRDARLSRFKTGRLHMRRAQNARLSGRLIGHCGGDRIRWLDASVFWRE
jgi:hypothetical protein